jgi:hypothetical protein
MYNDECYRKTNSLERNDYEHVVIAEEHLQMMALRELLELETVLKTIVDGGGVVGCASRKFQRLNIYRLYFCCCLQCVV